MNVLYAITILLVSFVGDIAWAKWSILTNSKRPLLACLWSVGLVFIGWVNINAYIQSPWYIVPTALGAGLGTFAVVDREKRKG